MKQDLIIKKIQLDDNNILIKKFIKGIEGGRTLDVTAYEGDVVKAGHVIIKKANGNYAPLGIETVTTTTTEGSATTSAPTEDVKQYAALPEGASYAGLLQASILKEAPAAAIMTWGIVNEKALPYAVPSAFKTALPHIDFQVDEEA